MEISADAVKQLRAQTNAGIMDCKKALQENDGDMEKAVDWLRKKGAATAEKKSGRATNEGVIHSYIHPGSRLGVLVELNCETDFVAKTEDFVNLARDIAMQVAAANPKVVQREDLSAEVIERELEIYRTQAKNEKKPDNVVERIATGKLEKYYQENVLLEQNFIKDSDRTVKEVMNDVIGKLGENITIGRFVRFQIGE